jgi:predicted porin
VYSTDVFNTFYVEGRYPIPIDDKTRVTLGAQYYPQKSIGDDQIGSFSTWGLGLTAALNYGPWAVQGYYTQTGTGFTTQSPYGDHPSYLNLQQIVFNTAGEKAWAIRGTVDFATIGAPGLVATAIYASGKDRVNSANGAPLPDHHETDVRADYAFAKGTMLDGLVATFRYSWLTQVGSPQTQTDLRAILNYGVRF